MISVVKGALDKTPVINGNAYIGTLGVFIGAGISALNSRLLSVGLADIRGAMGLSYDEASWITTVYGMAVMFMGALSVYLGGLFGTRRVLLAGGLVFTLSSLLLPFAPNYQCMLLLLVLSGIGAGPFYPLALAYSLRALPMRIVIYAICVYSIDVLGSIALSVPLEGWLMDNLSWRWIFWICALLTPLMMVCIYTAIPNPAPRPKPAQKKNYSWLGFFLASVGLSFVYGALDQGERVDWLNSPLITTMFMVSLAAFLGAIVCRRLNPNPFVDLRSLCRRNTIILGICLFCFRFVLLAMVFLIPVYLGSIRNYNAIQTGYILMWVAIPQIIFGYIAARLMRRIHGHMVLTAGFVFVCAACLLNTCLTSQWYGGNFIIAQIIIACGLSFNFVGLVGCILQQGAETKIFSKPVVTLTFVAYFHVVRIFGGEAGLAAMQRLVSIREKFHSSIIGERICSGDVWTYYRLRFLTKAVFSRSSGMYDAHNRAMYLLGKQVQAQAFTIACGDCFKVVAVVAIAACIIALMIKPTKLYYDSKSDEAYSE